MSKTRRTRPSPASRLRAFWLIGLFFFALFGVGVYEAALWPGFHLSGIEVLGVHTVAREEVIRRAELDPDTNLWLQNMRAAQRRIEGIPYVAAVRVHRRFPASVWIAIVERKPEGCVRAADGERFTVDGQERVLEEECEPLASPLYRLSAVKQAARPGTFLHSPALARLQTNAHALEGLEPGVFTAFSLDTFDQFEAMMRSGVLVRFGADADLAEKARLVKPILAAVAARTGEIKAVDVRALAAPIVEYRSARRAQD